MMKFHQLIFLFWIEANFFKKRCSHFESSCWYFVPAFYCATSLLPHAMLLPTRNT